MSGTDRMNALTNGQMASASTVAQLIGAAAGTASGAGASARAPDERPELRHKDGLA